MMNYFVKQLSLLVAYAGYLIDLPGGFGPYFGNLGGRGYFSINDEMSLFEGRVQSNNIQNVFSTCNLFIF